MSHRRGNLLTSFNYAFDGIVHALRYERNMWIHFGIAGLVLIAGLFFALTRVEVIALLVAISFVLITEMFNTAIEHVVDLVTDEDDPRARVAKDVAAGAVLIAAVNAVAVAYLVFYDKITSVPYTILSRLRGSPIDVTVIALFIVILAAIALKALTHRGTAFHGGLPSVHAGARLRRLGRGHVRRRRHHLRAADLGDHAVPGRAGGAEPRAGQDPHAARRWRWARRSASPSPRCCSGSGTRYERSPSDDPSWTHLRRSMSRPPELAERLLFQEALTVAENAYAPYSGYAVGAVAVGPSGRSHHGANVENASYPAGLCAERAALAALVTHGERELRYVAVAALDGSDCLPCGFCLQALAEFGDPELVVRSRRRADRRPPARAAHGAVRPAGRGRRCLTTSAAGSSPSSAGPTSASRRWSTPSWGARSASSATTRRPRGGASPASSRWTPARSSCSTCRASRSRSTRSRGACRRRSTTRSARSTPRSCS